MKIQSLEEAKKIRDELYQTAVDAFLDTHGFCPDEFLNEEEAENFLEAEEYIEKHEPMIEIELRGRMVQSVRTVTDIQSEDVEKSDILEVSEKRINELLN